MYFFINLVVLKELFFFLFFFIWWFLKNLFLLLLFSLLLLQPHGEGFNFHFRTVMIGILFQMVPRTFQAKLTHQKGVRLSGIQSIPNLRTGYQDLLASLFHNVHPYRLLSSSNSRVYYGKNSLQLPPNLKYGWRSCLVARQKVTYGFFFSRSRMSVSQFEVDRSNEGMCRRKRILLDHLQF